jgi:ribokinase
VDTTGAGDCFNGALAFALSQGYQLKDAVISAVTIASYSVQSSGTMNSYPTTSDDIPLKITVTNQEEQK